jgi:hypothetical protein
MKRNYMGAGVLFLMVFSLCACQGSSDSGEAGGPSGSANLIIAGVDPPLGG